MPREQVLAQESIDYPLPTLSCAASAYTHTRPLRYPPNELPRPVHKRLRRVDGLRCPPRRVDAVARLHRDQVGAEPRLQICSNDVGRVNQRLSQRVV